MKKFISLITLVLITCFIIVINLIIRDESKITYKSASLRKLSLENEVTDELNDFDIVTIEINLNTFPAPINCYLDENATHSETQFYKKYVKEIYRKYFHLINSRVVASLNINEYFDIYISKYSPIIEYSFKIDDYIENNVKYLDIISSNNSVDNIKVYGVSNVDSGYEPMIAGSAERLGMDDIYTNKVYTGDGVKIGMMESGIPDTSHANLSGQSITVRDEWYYSETITDHATKMASIIAGTTGLASDASLYAVEIFGNPTSEIDWLLDHDVDVVNCSFTTVDDYGYYSDFSAYFDYITKTYGLLFVAAVGNRGASDDLVGNPALGYNLLGVGGTSFSSYYDYSSSITLDGPCKPNFCAPSDWIVIPNYSGGFEGTSCGCAVTTGTIAILMEKYPILKVRPELVNAILTSGATELDTIGEPDVNGLNEFEGAGLINYQNTCADYEVTSVYFSYDYPNDTDNIVHYESHEFYEGEVLQVATSTLAFANGDKDDTYCAGIKINLYKDNYQTLVASVYSSADNNTYLRYIVPEESWYTIEIVYMGCSGSITYPLNIGYSFHIYDPAYE